MKLKLILVAAIFIATPCAARDKIAAHHMIAAANPYASQAGLQMLRKGGSAADAAIAAQMVLTLVEPESSGIGG
ncbi:MAG TPA: gamma-glutamyltransferase, partial [Rhizomicrobium sp.]|nr:gamma-glutamyltransferase [Rhizomicrobium sp.]